MNCCPYTLASRAAFWGVDARAVMPTVRVSRIGPTVTRELTAPGVYPRSGAAFAVAVATSKDPTAAASDCIRMFGSTCDSPNAGPPRIWSSGENWRPKPNRMLLAYSFGWVSE